MKQSLEEQLAERKRVLAALQESYNGKVQRIAALEAECLEMKERLLNNAACHEEETNVTKALSARLARELAEAREEARIFEGLYDQSKKTELTLVERNAALRAQLVAAQKELRSELSEIKLQNAGVDIAAEMLLLIAQNGRDAGVFGGKKLEQAAQAILDLRAQLATAQAEAAEYQAQASCLSIDCDMLKAEAERLRGKNGQLLRSIESCVDCQKSATAQAALTTAREALEWGMKYRRRDTYYIRHMEKAIRALDGKGEG